AQSELHDRGLTFQIDRQPHDVIGANQVFDQDPKADTSVHKGAAVTLRVSSGKPTVAVPSVVGGHADNAIRTLQAAGFNVAEDQRSDRTRPADVVIATTPTAGSVVPRGSTVTVVVSTGPTTTTTVPVPAFEDTSTSTTVRRTPTTRRPTT